jgi:MoaA/NifB/PqqE/SkfB family radical SAM enzyme
MVCHMDARQCYDRFISTFLPVAEKHSNVFLHLKQPVTWPSDTPNKGFVDEALRHNPKVIFDDRATPLSIGKGCTQPDRFLMVLADGSCTSCCVDANDWGLPSVRDHSLKEVWESARRLEIVKLWRKKDDSIPCGRCLKRTDCIQ